MFSYFLDITSDQSFTASRDIKEIMVAKISQFFRIYFLCSSLKYIQNNYPFCTVTN